MGSYGHSLRGACPMPLTTSQKGDLSEAAVLAAFVKRRVSISIPWGNSQAYDLIADVNGSLLRIQVKTGVRRGAFIVFRCCSQTRDRKPLLYDGKADYYAVFCPDDDRVYILPVAECGRSATYIRVDYPVRDTGTSKVNLADDCDIDTWISRVAPNIQPVSRSLPDIRASRKRGTPCPSFPRAYDWIGSGGIPEAK